MIDKYLITGSNKAVQWNWLWRIWCGCYRWDWVTKTSSTWKTLQVNSCWKGMSILMTWVFHEINILWLLYLHQSCINWVHRKRYVWDGFQSENTLLLHNRNPSVTPKLMFLLKYIIKMEMDLFRILSLMINYRKMLFTQAMLQRIWT